jgi:hypothetical protein
MSTFGATRVRTLLLLSQIRVYLQRYPSGLAQGMEARFLDRENQIGEVKVPHMLKEAERHIEPQDLRTCKKTPVVCTNT